jgi:hypothetical protein
VQTKYLIEQYKRLVAEESPVKPFEDVPEPASYTDIAAALQDNKLKKGLVYLNKNIPEDTTVGLRLDIPAYKDHDVWVASIHLPKGEGTTYGKTGWIKDVTFGDAKLSTKSFEIAMGKAKSPVAQMTGKWKNHTPGDAYRQAKEFLNDKEWTQVGYNPFKFGYFYDRLTMNPVVAADEVIQVGPFVIAKNVTTALPTDKRFEVKTKEGNRFNFEEGGKVSTNEQMDRLGFDKGGETSGPPKFEKRIARPDPEMFIKDPQSGNPQTHRMGWGDIEGQFIAYPTIIEQDGKLVQYGNNTETMKLMKKSGNFKAFDTKEEAEAYADGGWKTKEFNKTYRKGFDNGGAILNYIAQARGYEDPAFLKQYADEVKWQETRGAGPTTVQNNNGPARGSYQVEGSQGSGRNETILQRAQNFYEKYPDAPKSKEITYALEQRGKDLDFSSLSDNAPIHRTTT